MHGAERRVVWVPSRPGQGCKAYQRADRQWRHPVIELSRQRLPGGRRSESSRSLGGSFLTDFLRKQPAQMVFIQMQGQSRAWGPSSHSCIRVDRGKSKHKHRRSHKNLDVMRCFKHKNKSEISEQMWKTDEIYSKCKISAVWQAYIIFSH